MKVDLITNYSSSIRLNKPKYGLESAHKHSEDMYKSADENVNRGYYSGSFTGREKAAASFLQKAKKSFSDYTFRTLNKASDWCHSQTSIMQAFIAMLVAVGPRPLAIMVLPGKSNKRSDKAAAATHAMSSGVVGFAFASVVMYPIGKAAKKIYNPSAKEGEYVGDAIVIKENLKKEFSKIGKKHTKDITLDDLKTLNITEESLLKGTQLVSKKFLNLFGEFKDGVMVKLNKNLDIDKVAKFLNMGPDTFVFGVVKAMLTVALIPPIMKYLFGIDKNKPKNVQPKVSEQIQASKQDVKEVK